MKIVGLVLSALLVMTSACSDDEGGSERVTVEIRASDSMSYNVDRIEATAGQQVRLVLRHTGTQPIETMGHNVVILAQGVDVTAFAAAAAEAGAEAGYIPAGREADIIAHTELVGGGAMTNVTFTAPAAGTYDFICSFPGHAGAMRGQLVVSAQ